MTKHKLTLNGSKQIFETAEEMFEYKQQHPNWNNAEYEAIEMDTPEVGIVVPQNVPLWCLRTVLRSMNLLNTVKQTIASMPESVEKIAAEEGIEYANTVLRQSPTTLFIQSVLQLTDEQVDQIFISADRIEA